MLFLKKSSVCAHAHPTLESADKSEKGIAFVPRTVHSLCVDANKGSQNMNITQILSIARTHLGKGSMESSARLCLADAVRMADDGNIAGARTSAAKSIAYSVGIFHADYQSAFGGKHWAHV